MDRQSKLAEQLGCMHVGLTFLQASGGAAEAPSQGEVLLVIAKFAQQSLHRRDLLARFFDRGQGLAMGGRAGFGTL